MAVKPCFDDDEISKFGYDIKRINELHEYLEQKDLGVVEANIIIFAMERCIDRLREWYGIQDRN